MSASQAGDAVTASGHCAGPYPLLLLAAGIVVYSNSFRGVFVFDDIRCILHNEGIRRLWPLWKHLVTERGLVEISFAVNHAVGGTNVWGYHAFNLSVHLLAALILFAVVRRTLLLEPLRPSFGRTAPWLALAVALPWTVHPLQTESVTYVTQRAESMVSLFYLLTLYCVIRGAGSERAGWWYTLAVAGCALGARTKPVIITAPVVILLYDRIFLCRSFSEVIRRRWPLYVGLAATWLLLTTSILSALNPDLSEQTAGLSYKGTSPWRYLLTQAGVIVHYIELSFWPRHLCIDYKWPIADSPRAVIVPGLVILGLLTATGLALWRKPHVGFLGAWFFLLLAPTSSILPIRDVAVEHRMYLALAAVVALVVIAVRWALRQIPGHRMRKALAGGLIVVVALLLGYRTIQRNRDYHSEVAFWESVVAQRPKNYRAINNVGWALGKQGKKEEAIEWYRRSLALNPRYYWAHHNLAVALEERGDQIRAIEHYKNALKNKPSLVQARRHLARLLTKLGRTEEADKYLRGRARPKPGPTAR